MLLLGEGSFNGQTSPPATIDHGRVVWRLMEKVSLIGPVRKSARRVGFVNLDRGQRVGWLTSGLSYRRIEDANYARKNAEIKGMATGSALARRRRMPDSRRVHRQNPGVRMLRPPDGDGVL